MLPLLVLFLLMALCLSDCQTISFWSRKETLIVNFAIFGLEVLSFSKVARRILDAGAEAVGFVSRFLIGGLDSY